MYIKNRRDISKIKGLGSYQFVHIYNELAPKSPVYVIF